MARETFAVVGSGTTPFMHGHIDHDAYPAKFISDDFKVREGSNAVIINPEDFSVWRGGSTRLVNVGGAATRLDTGLEYRRAIALANISSTEILYFGFTNTVTTTVGNTGGFVVFPRTSISIDAKNLYALYGITTGTTIQVAVLEVS